MLMLMLMLMWMVEIRKYIIDKIASCDYLLVVATNFW